MRRRLLIAAAVLSAALFFLVPAALRAVAPAAAEQPAARPPAAASIGVAARGAPLTRPAGRMAHGLPLRGVPAADLAFAAEAARLGGGKRSPATDRLLALARAGATHAALQAAVERELAGDLALRLAARRWLAARAGETAPPIVTPRPGTRMVGDFSAAKIE